MESIYESRYMGFWIKIYEKHIEFNIGGKIQSIPISQISSIQLGTKILFLQEKKIILETTGGKKYTIPVKNPNEVQEKIYSLM